MLAQLVALLTLGVLCSSAPMPTARSTNTAGPSQPDHCSSGSIIKELLHIVKNGTMIEVTESFKQPKDPKKCVHDSLNIFITSLKENETKNQNTITQLSRLYECKSFFSEDLYKECKFARVFERHTFMKTLENFLLYLNGKI